MGKIRVNSRSLKGLSLNTLHGELTRPTSGKLRAAVIDILRPHFTESITFWDCFAGSGAMGIEAISNGATVSRLFETHPAAYKIIETNVKAAELRGATQLAAEKFDCFKLHSFHCDILWADPPYSNVGDWLEHLKTSNLDAVQIIICEAPKSLDWGECRLNDQFALSRHKYYGDTQLLLWQRGKN